MVKRREPLEIWGGIECTVNRVQNNYFDQLYFSGHYSRDTDIQLLADLGIKKIRYPVIWEKHQPNADAGINWSHTEQRLKQIRELGINPIAGLVHHGSGPEYASIETDCFAPGLAAFARKVAEKFPWIEYYTPINEPLTTARFCGLYGHWYPHKRNNADFLRLLINETKATILAMEAIREVNPGAKLIQTEDLGKTYSTPLLQYQADFENHRRWLSIDLLMGKVTEKHSLWGYLMWSGIKPEELSFFQEKNCMPDIIGFNYYPTSERFLDENLSKYPLHTHGGNHQHRYADVEAVRVDLEEDEYGADVLLNEAWDYFGLPIAVTEVHLGCTREEQLRWLHEIHSTASAIRNSGVDLVAVTPWAMMGSYGWNKLLTEGGGSYESGVFDLRSQQPRATILAEFIKSIGKGEVFNHPALESKGWWRNDLRILYFQNNIRHISTEAKTSQPILILGKTGTLGKAFARICHIRGLHYELLGREDLNLHDKAQIEQLIARKRPWAVINAAGFVRVDDAETSSNDCYKVNTEGPGIIASLAGKYGFKFLTFSSDLVFDGQKKQAYVESDKVSPLNIYGRSKALAEKLVLERSPAALIIRTSAFFGPWDQYNFAHSVLSTVMSGSSFTAVSDQFVSPTYVPDLVNASLDLMIDNECGVWHLANTGEISWSGFASSVVKQSLLNSSLIIPVPGNTMKFPAMRPAYSVLHSEKAILLPSLEDAIGRYLKEQELINLASQAVETA